MMQGVLTCFFLSGEHLFLIPCDDRTDFETITLIIAPLPDSSPTRSNPTRQHENKWELGTRIMYVAALVLHYLCSTTLSSIGSW